MEPIGFWVTQASTVLLVVLGAFVVAVRPRLRTTLAFGASTTALGVAVLMVNFARRFGADLPVSTILWLMAALGLAFVIVGVGATYVFLNFPEPLSSADRPKLWLPAAFALAGAAFGAFEGDQIAHAFSPGPPGAWFLGVVVVAFVIQFAAHGLLAGAAGLFALRYAAPHTSTDHQTQYSLMAAGLAAWPAALGGGYFSAAVPLDRNIGYFALFTTLSVVVSWIVATRAANSRPARNVVLILSGSAGAGLAVEWFSENQDIDDTGFFGAIRLFSFAIFSYAILRHHLLGLDVKVRWTISRSSLAGLFVLLVLVGSQVVQNVTQAEFGVWAGAILAGLALFVLSPLQRAADAFAHRLVPMDSASASRAAREATLAEAVRMALRGGISYREERTLANLARDLGVDARRAFDLRQSMERNARTRRQGKKR
jgi:hypothetical protein